MAYCAPIEAKTKKISQNKRNITFQLGAKTTLKIKGIKKKIRWTTGNQKIVKVQKGKVFAKGMGKTTLTAKTGKKKIKYYVTVTIQKGDTMKDSEMSYSNEIFSKKLFDDVVSISAGRADTLVKDRAAIRKIYSNFASAGLTEAPQPTETLYGHHTFIFTLKNGEKKTILVQGDYIAAEGKLYKAEGIDGVKISRYLKKYAAKD